MSDARTDIDSLGFHLSDPAGLGGARADLEHWALEPIITPGIPSLVIEQVSAACGEGECQIIAVDGNALRFSAPGEALGEAVIVAANTSAVLASETPEKTARVYRDALYNAADLSGELRFSLVKGVNNAIGMADETVSGGTRYGCLWLHNRSAEAIADIEVTGGGAYTVALQAPTLGRVEATADDSTAPTGVTFGAMDTAASLAAGESIALRFRRVLSSPAMDPFAEGAITVAWVSDGETYSQVLPGLYRVADSSLAGFAVYVGEDGAPDFEGAPAGFGALPLAVALTPGHTHRWAVREVNEFGLSSLNTLTRSVSLDGDGENVSEALTNPEVISITSGPGGEVDVRLRYNGMADATPADTFRLYVGANVSINGDDPAPDPETDPPVDTVMVVMGLARPDLEMVVKLGPYGYGVPVAVIARVYSSELDAESNSNEVHTVTVSTQGPVGMHQFALAAGSRYGAGRSLSEGTVYYDAPTNSVGVRTLSGEVVLFGSGDCFRAAYGSETLFRTTFSIQTIPHSEPGANTPIEAVSPDEVYINVAGVRRVKFDFLSGVVECAAFTLGAERIDLPVIGPIYITGSATYIMVRNSLTGRWTPALGVDDEGRLTIYLPYKQEIA